MGTCWSFCDHLLQRGVGVINEQPCLERVQRELTGSFRLISLRPSLIRIGVFWEQPAP